MDDAEKLLRLAADMESLCSSDDALSRLIGDCSDGELSADDLDWVAAAASRPDYRRFLEMIGRGGQG